MPTNILKNSINRDRLMRASAILLMHVYYCNFRECGTSASHSASYLCKCSCRGLCPRLMSWWCE